MRAQYSIRYPTMNITSEKNIRCVNIVCYTGDSIVYLVFLADLSVDEQCKGMDRGEDDKVEGRCKTLTRGKLKS